MVVATAYMEEAERFDWLAAMNAGTVLATGSPAELKASTGATTIEDAFIALLPEQQRGDHHEMRIPPRHSFGTEPIIIARNLTCRFGDFTAVDRVSFTIERGEIFGFLGSNGCGKTTTMKILTGLLPPSEGEALLFGQPLDASDMSSRYRVGYMSQSFSLYTELTVRQNLDLHARLFHLPAQKAKTRIAELVGKFGLEDYLDQRTLDLPLGIRQRLSLAVAIVHEPEILILDEPTSALDPVGRHDVREIIRGLASRGTAVFLNSHLLSEVEQVCDRVAVVDHGRVIASGTMDQLLSGTTVKVRATGLDREGKAKMAAFGQLDDEGDQLTFTNLKAERVPDLVAAIIALGGRIYEVAPRQQTLEDRFLQLIQDEEDK